MSNGSFSTGLKSWPALFAKRHRDLKRGVGIQLFGSVIRDSPVDTGRLRSNWQTSLSAVDHSSEDTSVSEAAAIGKMTGVVMGAEAKDSMFIANSLPYVARIEYDGWSHTKAPQGMVNRNVLRFRNILSKQNNLLKTKGGAL